MKLKKILNPKIIAGAICVVGAFGLAYKALVPAPKAVALLTVTKGSISQKVIVTGKTKPIDTLDLAFERGGMVVRTPVQVGDKVEAGQTLVQLDANELQAQLMQANAALLAEQAKLDELKTGARPEDIQVKKTELAKAEQDLTNYYGAIPNLLNDAYQKADDAIRNQLSSIFVNNELTFTPDSGQMETDAESSYRQSLSTLGKWRTELLAITNLSSQATLDAQIQSSVAALTLVRTLLERTMDALSNSVTLPSATASTYKASVSTARTNVSAALTSLTNQSQTISSQKITVERIKNELALKLAGSTKNDIDAQKAMVEKAEASARLIQVQIGKTTLRAPVAGVVTKQDAKIGEIIVSNSSVVSLVSEGDLQIEANVPEVDIGKIAVANPVSITLDAFPGETFIGKVIKIDPGETIVDGVVNFKITIAFTTNDPRLKSGLTANLEIETLLKTGVLVLPQYAILQNDEGTFVEKPEGNTTGKYPIKTGVRDQNGNVEILSGVAEGDRVVNIGARAKAE